MKCSLSDPNPSINNNRNTFDIRFQIIYTYFANDYTPVILVKFDRT